VTFSFSNIKSVGELEKALIIKYNVLMAKSVKFLSKAA
jgi:hypothetical protein